MLKIKIMSKKVLKILNDFREWNRDWERYDKGISKERPKDSNSFANAIAEFYNIKDDETKDNN